MPVEIIDYLFDYLDLGSLSAIGATCKQMQQIAGHIFQRNYSGLLAYFYGSKKEWEVKIPHSKCDHAIDIKYFVPFVDKIFCGHKRYLKIHNPQSAFHQLKQLTVERVDFDAFEIDGMEGVLDKLKYLQISFCKMDENFLEKMLALSPNLKRLCLAGSYVEEKWLERSYPTLEHFEITSTNTIPITTLLTLNPNIRKFGTHIKNLWNIGSLADAGVKLEELSIQIECDMELSYCALLNEYHQFNVYKR